jgi:hypothetical protein
LNSTDKQHPKLDFFGRERDFKYITKLAEGERKIIVIQAAGGVGKSILAHEYLKSQEYDEILKLTMPKGIKNTKNIISAEDVVKSWLEDLNKKPPSDSEFEGNLSILGRFLRKKRIGILIDNLEPALNKDGKFIDKHRSYVRLLETLADLSARSLTLITSRDLLHENIENIEQYSLKCLTAKAWDDFFKHWGIQTNLDDITDIHKV